MKVVLTHKAKADIREIGLFIGADSTKQAEAFVQCLTKAVFSLQHYPERHALLPDRPYRRLVFGNYLIFYKVSDRVDVLRIIHGARDWPSLLDDLG